MRPRKMMAFATLSAFLLAWTAGCSQSTDVSLAPATPTKPQESAPLPKDVKKGGGPGSSGNMGKNPGGNT